MRKLHRIAEGDDLPIIADMHRSLLIDACQSFDCFADNLKVPLYRKSK